LRVTDQPDDPLVYAGAFSAALSDSKAYATKFETAVAVTRGLLALVGFR
jgi:hypothetical protein